MQGWRQPQPSGTNRPSSYPSHPRGRSCMCLAGATHLRSKRDRIRRARCAAPRARGDRPLERGRHSHRLKTSAAHRSAAMAGGARPDPFRTRKLSRRAPMVLRGQPVGEQGAADRWTALDPFRAGRGGAAGDSLRRPPSLFSISFSRGPRGALFSCRHSALYAGRRGRAARPPGPAALLLCGRSARLGRRRSFRDPTPSSGYRAPSRPVGPLRAFPRAAGGA